MISLLTLLIHLIAVHAIDLDQALYPADPPSNGAQPPVLVVAKAGPETFPTVKQALEAADKYKGGMRVVIQVKTGEYNERVTVTRPNITLQGDGAGKTVITGDRSTAGGFSTYDTATFNVEMYATGFVGRGVTFRNTNVGTPAVAFQSSADMTVLYQCSVEGFQDTLDVLTGRHFYKDSHISGAVDFIFGFGAAVFQNCVLHLRNASTLYITAQGKASPANTTSGFVFHNCDVRATPELERMGRQPAEPVYLGRPWRAYAEVVFIKTYLDGHINPAGWAPWNLKDILPNTVYFGEYLNYGPGADVSRRTKWPGLHLLGSYAEASKFSVGRFLLANGDWLSRLGIPFNSSL